MQRDTYRQVNGMSIQANRLTVAIIMVVKRLLHV